MINRRFRRAAQAIIRAPHVPFRRIDFAERNRGIKREGVFETAVLRRDAAQQQQQPQRSEGKGQ